LLLQNVLDQTDKQDWEQSSDDEDKHSSPDDQPTTSTTTMKRVKSNLVLHAGAGDDDDEEDNGSNLCAICLCPYENGDQICWSHNQRCLHHFHAACGIAWLAKHEECPICRAEYLVEPETSEKDIEEGQSGGQQ
jgi:hypothetical protein